MTTERTALVLGATGGIGGEMARALRRRGWRCAPCIGERRRWWGVTVSTGAEAMEAADFLRAAEGAELIVHAVNPPGYRNWGWLMLPMLESSIAAARAARVSCYRGPSTSSAPRRCR